LLGFFNHFFILFFSLKTKKNKSSHLSLKPVYRRRRRGVVRRGGRLVSSGGATLSEIQTYFILNFFISISSSPFPLLISGLRFCKYPTKNPRSKFKVTTFLSKKERKNEEKRERAPPFGLDSARSWWLYVESGSALLFMCWIRFVLLLMCWLWPCLCLEWVRFCVVVRFGSVVVI